MPHFLGDQRGPQGTQRVMRAASWPKSIRAVQKVRLEHRFHNARDRTLNQSVFDRGDSQRELHLRTVRFWDGQKSLILSTHYVANVSKSSRNDA